MNTKKKNKKGFSLVELIIVIAIMVALIAVMAPSFVKYVKKSRDVVVTTAAEDVLSFVKAEYGMALTGYGTIKVGKSAEGNHIAVWFEDDNSFTYNDEENNRSGEEGFAEACGVDEGKACQSDLVYLISVTPSSVSAHPIIEEVSTREANS